MKILRAKWRAGMRLRLHAVRADAERAGSILVAVLWLLALLWIIGIFFFLFANTEQTAAQYYADAAKVDNRCGVDPDILWDWALRQLIVGPKFNEDEDNDPLLGQPDSERQSQLYTFDSRMKTNLGRHSMLFHILGDDLQRYNGQGYHITSDATNPGMPMVDQDYDGIETPEEAQLRDFNYSFPAIQNPLDSNRSLDVGVVSAGVVDELPPATDVGYTYPDANARFLAIHIPPGPGPDGAPGMAGVDDDSDGVVDNDTELGTVGSDDTPLIIKPSFHMPGDLRTPGAPVTQIPGWDADPTTVRRVFRPHTSHQSIDDNGVLYPRYLTVVSPGPDGQPGTAGVDDDGNGMDDDAGELGFTGTDDVLAFPFTNNNATLPSGAANPSLLTIREGIWTGDTSVTGEPEYAYDVDADGDGIKESILIDLGFPVQSCEGKQFKVMFAIKVMDADGLVNLNAAGNTSGTRITNSMDPRLPDPLNPASIIRFSQSNQGISPSELSLRYALRAVPTSVVDTNPAWDSYKAMFGIDPLVDFAGTREQNRTVMSNMETFYLLRGRGVYDSGLSQIDSPLLGRYGDLSQLNTALTTLIPNDFPQPGIPLQDDDGDENDGELDPVYGHPLDFLGVGTYVDPTDGFTPITIGTAAPGDPNRWIQYYFYSSNGGVTYNSNVPDLMLDLTGSPGGVLNANIDEADELVLLPGYTALSNNDSSFGVEEMAGLHKSDSDPDANLVLSRLKDLLPINFKESTSAALIRKQFTSVSWDRVDFGVGRTAARGWEWSAGFPPQVPTGSLTGQQPLRQPLLDLLTMDSTATDANNAGLQRKLDLNRHLVGTNADGTPIYDELTPYSVDPVQARRDRQEKARDIYVLLYLFCGGDDGLGPDGIAFSGDETWFGVDGVPGSVGDDDGNGIVDDLIEYGWPGSDDQTYLSSNAGNAIYSDEQMRQMAQFAVNVVDALDEDNVMTEFEYDVDLGNGWNLDDDPHTTVDADLAERTVYGVEAQQLTFSEALAIYAPGLTSDHAATRYNDSNGGDRRYVFIELRNAGNRDVDLVIGPSQPAWQIVYDPNYNPTTNPYLETTNGTVLALQEIIQIHPTAAAQLGSRVVAAGDLFTIGTSGGLDYDAVNMEQRPSDFVVDWNLDGFTDYDLIVPRPSSTTNAPLTDPSNPSVDLDLSHPDHNGYGTTTDGNGQLLPLATGGPGPAPEFSGKGAFLTTAAASDTVTLHLRRLANPDLPFNAVTNRWVIVDQIQFVVSPFPLQTSDNAAAVTTHVDAILSDERRQPLYRAHRSDPPVYSYNTKHLPADINGPADDGINGTVGNSIDSINQLTENAPLNGVFTLWQPHFNRHFASLMELLSVPIFSPDKLTDELGIDGAVGVAAKLGIPLVAPTPPATRDGLGQEKFLFPQSLLPPLPPPSPSLNNRWYRLFEFVDVASRMHRNPTITENNRDRVPGGINLNTMRHPGVLGAMIDDAQIHDIDLLDIQEPNDRNWWDQFIAARDAVILSDGTPAGGNGLDPVTNEYIPGVAGTRPFRNFAHVDNGNLSIDHTIFRSLPGSAPPYDFSDQQVRRLFEIGTSPQHTNNNVDYHTRNRLLAKVMNHSTTRSHVFIVHIAAEFYEVVENTPGQPQIGGKLADAPEHRGFFIVDLSRPLAGYTPPTVAPQGTFNARRYVLYRKTIK